MNKSNTINAVLEKMRHDAGFYSLPVDMSYFSVLLRSAENVNVPVIDHLFRTFNEQVEPHPQ